MLTRRTVLGAGVALTAGACSAALGAFDGAANRRRSARPVNALLIDETIAMPRPLSEFIPSRLLALPVVGIQLDAASQGRLTGVLNTSHAIVGVSSGATLFCLERIAWDHGFRLIERSERCAAGAGDDACWQALAGFLSGSRSLDSNHSPLVQAYRPSRLDGIFHVWAMQKRAGPQLHHDRQEV